MRYEWYHGEKWIWVGMKTNEEIEKVANDHGARCDREHEINTSEGPAQLNLARMIVTFPKGENREERARFRSLRKGIGKAGQSVEDEDYLLRRSDRKEFKFAGRMGLNATVLIDRRIFNSSPMVMEVLTFFADSAVQAWDEIQLPPAYLMQEICWEYRCKLTVEAQMWPRTGIHLGTDRAPPSKHYSACARYEAMFGLMSGLQHVLGRDDHDMGPAGSVYLATTFAVLLADMADVAGINQEDDAVVRDWKPCNPLWETSIIAGLSHAFDYLRTTKVHDDMRWHLFGQTGMKAGWEVTNAMAAAADMEQELYCRRKRCTDECLAVSKHHDPLEVAERKDFPTVTGRCICNSMATPTGLTPRSKTQLNPIVQKGDQYVNPKRWPIPTRPRLTECRDIETVQEQAYEAARANKAGTHFMRVHYEAPTPTGTPEERARPRLFPNDQVGRMDKVFDRNKCNCEKKKDNFGRVVGNQMQDFGEGCNTIIAQLNRQQERRESGQRCGYCKAGVEEASAARRWTNFFETRSNQDDTIGKDGATFPNPKKVRIRVRGDEFADDVTDEEEWVGKDGWYGLDCSIYGKPVRMKLLPHERTGRHLTIKAIGPHVKIDELTPQDLMWLAPLSNGALDLYLRYHETYHAYVVEEQYTGHLLIEVGYTTKGVGTDSAGVRREGLLETLNDLRTKAKIAMRD